MKKILILLIVSFLLVGCNNATDMEGLNDKVIALEEALEIESMLIEDYESRINQLEDLLDFYTNELNTTIRENNALESSFEELKNETEEELEELRKALVEGGMMYNINVFLADEYYLTVGDTFQLFYRSVIQAQNPYGYYIRLKGTVGHAYNRYYEWTPAEINNNQTYSLTLEVCDDNGNVYGSKSTKLIVSKPTSEPTRNILAIGDSLTANGVWISSGYKKYIENGGSTINFIGTISSTHGGVTFNYEGRGGWQWSSFMNVSESPFKNNASNGISFLDYAGRLSVDTIDELYILLTWNGVGGSFREFDLSKEPLLSAKKLIDKYHDEYPNGKITLLGIPQPSVNAGLGAYYTINQSYGDNYGQFVTALNYNKALEDFAKMEEYKDFMRFVDVKGQFDSEYNMPTVSKPVNNQNSTTEQVGASMGMHPTNNGYLQIGDVFYRALSKRTN